MPLMLAFGGSFASCFLKGLQFKNVTGNHYKMVFVTSTLIAMSDFALVMLAVRIGWSLVVPWCLGGSIAMVLSMKFHDRIWGKKTP